MNVYKRLCFLLSFLVIVITLFVARNNVNVKSREIWRHAPQVIGLGDLTIEEEEEQTMVHPSMLKNSSLPQTIPNDLGQSNHFSHFRPGVPKPVGSVYTKAIVMGKILSEDLTWLEMANLHHNISTYIYHSDEKSIPASMRKSLLTLPKVKGHEAMVYLTYIIDHYDTLPDISIFLHAHQYAWHNNELLNQDAIEMITRLSAEYVTRQGYMNLRCHWKPGCPDYLHPGIVREDKDKKEEHYMARAWAIMFPGEPIPEAIASQCCAQFAVSRERIRSIPLERFKAYRNWLIKTPLRDTISGRVFEYTWHKIFTGQGSFCPDMRICYCDGYGVCFQTEEEFDFWFELKYRRTQAVKALDEWETLVRKLDKAKNQWRFGRMGVEGLEEDNLRIPTVDLDATLREEINRHHTEMEERRLEALKAGTDPRIRAKIAGRPWKIGDGF